ncbi:MAG: lysylphosphatidylglycerol synthase transmembrane domain-containing protein [Flavobacteriaceae bacterium]
MRKQLLKSLQLGISALFVYLFIKQLNTNVLIEVLFDVHWDFLILAMVFFLLSQYLSSLRLLGVFRYFSFPLQPNSNHRLYVLGMFYNFFLPGGIGGDAYKALKLHKTFEWSWKIVGKALVLDRAIGLGALLCCALLLDSKRILPIDFGWRIPIFVALIFLGYAATELIFKSKAIYVKTLLWSFAVQVMQLLSVASIVMALGIEGSFIQPLLLVFLLSAVASIVSFAGLGVREYLFLQSGTWLAISPELTAAVGVWFTLLTAVVSFFGIYYMLFDKRLRLSCDNTRDTTPQNDASPL